MHENLSSDLSERADSNVELLTWQYDYDKQNRISQLTDPGNKKTNFIYTTGEDNNCIEKITRKHCDDTNVTYEFDQYLRRKKMIDSSGVVNYSYDKYNHLSSVQRDNGPITKFEYDSLDRLIQITIDPFFNTRIHYDFLGRMDRLETPLGEISYQYLTGQNKKVRTLPNKISTIWEYNPEGLLSSLTHVLENNTVLAQYSYSYRPDNLIKNIIEWCPEEEISIDYDYDIVQRLVSISDSRGKKVEFEYDRFGNRLNSKVDENLNQKITYNWAGQITRLNGKPCCHDASGNMTAIEKESNARQFKYNGMNLLTFVQTNNQSIGYTFDGDGNLVERKANEKNKISFIPNPFSDKWQPLMATDENGNQTCYLWDADTPVGEIKSGKVRFFLHDHLGSIRYIVDENAKIIQKKDYAPFGEPVHKTQDKKFEPGFAGLFHDAESSLYVTRGRSYDPHLGRFLQIDPQHRIPTGSQNDASLYAYCGNDPVNYTDQDGQNRNYFQTGAPHILQQMKAYEQNRTSQLSEQLLSQIPDAANAQIDGLGLAISDVAYNAYGKFTGDVYSGFSGKVADPGIVYQFGELGTSGQLANVLRSSRNISGTPIPMPEFVAPHAVLNGQLGLNVINSYLGVMDAALNGLEAGAQTLNLIGQTTLASNPSLYLQNRHLWGWDGSGSYQLDGGSVNFNEVLFTHDPGTPWWQPGNIYRSHISEVSTPNEHHVITNINNTPSTSFMESFVMNMFPVGEYFDPGVSSSIQTIRSHTTQHITSPGQNLPLPPQHVIDQIDSYWTEGHYLNGPQSPPPGSPHGGGAMVPSNVGGIYLNGAGKALEHIGQITGIAIDEHNGRLVLISEQKDNIALPPLRLDDVVTIFKSVYELGEAPFVSIDPDPNDPKGPIMHTRHGKATKQSYVGWIMFEADRVMKTYSIGEDNISKKKIVSRIDGYNSLLDLGLSDPEQGDPVWERFWIVPENVHLKNSSTKRLGLFDIPLKVMTQRMVLKEGKLVPAPDDTPSPQAKAFAQWFTQNYDLLSEESLSYPPESLGIEAPVSFFKELQRVALITAIAEHLRSQGISMPHWMKNHQVKPCHLDSTTPAINVSTTQTVTRKTGKWFWTGEETVKLTRQIYGGVNLSVDDENIIISNGDAHADDLSAPLWEAIDQAPDSILTPVAFKAFKKTYNAVALPSNRTKALGASQIKETDLSIPFLFGLELKLERVFHSFFMPSGELGSSWTLDLPFLEKQKEPIKKSHDQIELKTVLNLTSPLNTYSARFNRYQFVPELNVDLLVTDNSSGILGMGRTQHNLIGFETDVIFYRDGSQLHFDDNGNLAARITAPLTVLYQFTKRCLKGLRGFYGSKKQAQIELVHDENGRIIKAIANNGQLIDYTYSSIGELSEVKSSSSTMAYEYENHLLSKILVNNEIFRTFEYSPLGELTKEWQKTGTDDGIQIIYMAATGKKYQSTSGTKTIEEVEFDVDFKPNKKTLSDGSKILWEKKTANEITTTCTIPSGEEFIINQSKDGLNRTWKLPQDVTVQTEHDPAGRLTVLSTVDHIVKKQSWRQDGQLEKISTASSAFHHEYDPEGILKRVLITPPTEDTQFSQWMSRELDEHGRPVEISDYSGLKIQTEYDPAGKPVSIATNNNIINFNFNENNRLTEIDMPTINKKINYKYNKDTGSTEQMYLQQENGNASIFFDNALPVKTIQFDGGTYDISYENQEAGINRVKKIKTPDDSGIEYEYDTKNHLSSIHYDNTYKLKYLYDDQGRINGHTMIKTG
ncbi:MAG: RHS repeat-associated core domain-containing protein [Pseudomonadota bacterium]